MVRSRIHPWAGLAVLALLAPSAAAQPADVPAGPGAEEAVPIDGEAAPVSAPAPVSLDSLLELPDSVEVGVDRRGKATENEWRSRFLNAHLELAGARRDLAESQQALEKMASSGQWAFSPPGVNVEANANVDSHRLRMDIKRQRAEVERAERSMRELEVEANLANVPEAWREGPSPE